jgi:thiol-disulfide isomerase/thioredoxin
VIFLGIIFTQFFAAEIYSQAKIGKTPAPAKTTAISAAPKITQVDGAGLKNILKANGKPLLVNFWATWCDPCREEFPDLVKIDADYKNKIDFITVSLDEVEELKTGVPKFLAEMKAQMPAYLLTTQDEDALIGFVSKDWQGGLPFTILYDASGKTAYTRMGKVKIDVLRAELEKILSTTPAAEKPSNKQK